MYLYIYNLYVTSYQIHTLVTVQGFDTYWSVPIIWDRIWHYVVHLTVLSLRVWDSTAEQKLQRGGKSRFDSGGGGQAVAYPEIFSGGKFRQEFFSVGGGVQQIQLRTEGRENEDLGAVAP
jgi:hypothetical protein